MNGGKHDEVFDEHESDILTVIQQTRAHMSKEQKASTFAGYAATSRNSSPLVSSSDLSEVMFDLGLLA